jgi:RNA polymerase sigma factor (sigma-70 family)
MSVEEEYDDEVAALYRKHVGQVLAFSLNMGCDQGLAEEIANDAFLGARRRWDYVRSLEKPEGYVFKIARNERSRRQKQYDCHAKDLQPDPSSAAQNSDDDPVGSVLDRAVVRQALQQLPSRQREAVILLHVVDLSEATTAEIMGIHAGTVKRYAHEGRQRLRLLLADFRHQRGGNA